MARRLQRSHLAVPGSSERFFAKAAASGADAVFLDLEDAVAPSRKVDARGNVIRALNEIDWGAKTMSVRVNSLDSEWGVRDVIDVVSLAPRIDLVMIPKVQEPFEVQFVDALLSALERESGRATVVGIEAVIETARGLANVEQIASVSPRLESMSFGIGDYAISMGIFEPTFGIPNPAYAICTVTDEGERPRYHWQDQWHYALARIANACRANDLRPIDGPWAHYGDLKGFRESAGRAAVLGYEGKWAIHPSQVEGANEAFTPSAAQVAWARELLEALDEAIAQGSGVIGRDGKLYDLAHRKLALAVLERSRASEGGDGGG